MKILSEYMVTLPRCELDNSQI